MKKFLYTICLLTGTYLIADRLESFDDDVILLQNGKEFRGYITKVPLISYHSEKPPLSINEIAKIEFLESEMHVTDEEGIVHAADIPADSFEIVQYLPTRENPKYSMQNDLPPNTIKYLAFKIQPSKLKQTVDTAKSQVKNLQALLAERQEKISILENADLELRIAYEEASGLLDIERKQNIQHEASLDQFGLQIQDQEQLIAILNDENQESESNINRLTSQLQDREETIATLNAERQGREETIATLNAELATLSADKHENQTTLERLTYQFHESETALNHSKSELEKQRETVATLSTEKQSLLDRLDVALERLAVLETDHQSALSELESERSQKNEALVRFKNSSIFAESLENQLHALTTRSIALGEQFSETHRLYRELENKAQELNEANQHLQQENLLAHNHLKEERERNLSLQEGVISITEKARTIDEDLIQREEEITALKDHHQKEMAALEENHSTIANELRKEFDRLLALLDVERNKNTELTANLDNLQRVSVASNNMAERDMLKKERDSLQEKLERLTQIVNVQKSTLERIEKSRLALQEGSE